MRPYCRARTKLPNDGGDLRSGGRRGRRPAPNGFSVRRGRRPAPNGERGRGSKVTRAAVLPSTHQTAERRRGPAVGRTAGSETRAERGRRSWIEGDACGRIAEHAPNCRTTEETSGRADGGVGDPRRTVFADGGIRDPLRTGNAVVDRRLRVRPYCRARTKLPNDGGDLRSGGRRGRRPAPNGSRGRRGRRPRGTGTWGLSGVQMRDRL